MAYRVNKTYREAVNWLWKGVNKKVKKVKFLILAIVATMALVGSAYAWWSQTLFAQGDVSSSNLYLTAATNTVYQGNDQCTATGCDTCCGGFPYGASATNGVTVTTEPQGENDNTTNNNNTVTFHVTGAWPGYWSVLTYTVTNDGAVPWQFDPTQNAATFRNVPTGFDVVAFNANGINFNNPNWWAPYATADGKSIDPSKLPQLNGVQVCNNANTLVGILVYMPYGNAEDDTTMNTTVATNSITASFHVTQLTPGNGNGQ